LGLILCAGKSEEHVELLEVKRSGIRVAQYLTELPPQEVLRERLHRMVRAARERHAALKAIDAPADGAPIAFRGLRHAPINEQGVVYLFGMVSEELGLIVEAVQSAYPDCEVDNGVPVYPSAVRCARAMHALLDYRTLRHGLGPCR